MARLVLKALLFSSIFALFGCPAQDWMKRDDSYLSVEQYKLMTEVIRINDNLYRVKRGEELNQNQITQLFINFQAYMGSPEKEQSERQKQLKEERKTNPTVFNTMSYVLVLLEKKEDESEALELLSKLDYSTMNHEDKNIFNLAQILHVLLKNNKDSYDVNADLNKEISDMNKKYELVKEEMIYLNKQVNALKSIEDSIHSREVGLELESR